MKDIDIAKNLLNDEQLALVIVKGGDIIYKSNGRGIAPLYTAYKDMKESLAGASVADKVTGKAAAILCVNAGIQELYTNLISENALEVLDKSEIKTSYDKSVPFIKNRDNTGLCPIEEISLKAENLDMLLLEIDNFLRRINGK